MNDVREKPGEASQYISINYPVSQSYIYQTPLVHDSPASRAQSSIEDLVPQTYRFVETIPKQNISPSTIFFPYKERYEIFDATKILSKK